jgi:hypothetical protein
MDSRQKSIPGFVWISLGLAGLLDVLLKLILPRQSLIWIYAGVGIITLAVIFLAPRIFNKKFEHRDTSTR